MTVLDVACPACGAAVGQPCDRRHLRAERRSMSHRERWRAFWGTR